MVEYSFPYSELIGPGCTVGSHRKTIVVVASLGSLFIYIYSMEYIT